jgi:hypothetical protein
MIVPSQRSAGFNQARVDASLHDLLEVDRGKCRLAETTMAVL